MNIRTEMWNGHSIRFVEVAAGDWWAVAKDVSSPLGYQDSNKMTRTMDKEEVSVINWKKMQTPNLDVWFSDYKYKSNVPIISETGIYEAVFNSSATEALDFKKWVKQMLKNLRQLSGFEGFQIFRMLDRDHQKEMMRKLSDRLDVPVRVDFIKANTIANKAVSSAFGHPKMLKKEQMTPEMIVQRQHILEDTVDLMAVVDKFDIGISVSDTIYSKYVQ